MHVQGDIPKWLPRRARLSWRVADLLGLPRVRVQAV
jgi:hypothetical protein